MDPAGEEPSQRANLKNQTVGALPRLVGTSRWPHPYTCNPISWHVHSHAHMAHACPCHAQAQAGPDPRPNIMVAHAAQAVPYAMHPAWPYFCDAVQVVLQPACARPPDVAMGSDVVWEVPRERLYADNVTVAKR